MTDTDGQLRIDEISKIPKIVSLIPREDGHNQRWNHYRTEYCQFCNEFHLLTDFFQKSFFIYLSNSVKLKKKNPIAFSDGFSKKNLIKKKVIRNQVECTRANSAGIPFGIGQYETRK